MSVYRYTGTRLESIQHLTMEKKQTVRQEIISRLKTGPMTVREISQSVRIMEKEVYHHLPFIVKTLGRQNQRIQITPCYCRNCGFQFKKRKRFKKPGKCPACWDGRIASAVLWIS